jgi:murein L,D-transpeptidase YcbB/YkuD
MFPIATTWARRAVALLAPVALLAACSSGESNAGTSEGDVRHGAVWSPANLTAVNGIPVATLQSAVSRRTSGARPAEVGEEAWKHTRRLYRRYAYTPLWFIEDGLTKDRAGALIDAVLEANADALKLDGYPIAKLAEALAAVRRTKQPSAEQVADADVLLTATYAALAEDLLVGQVNPKTVGQSWHIAPNDENVDSALVRTLGRMPLDAAIGAMRPRDEDYAGLRKELARYRDLVAKGGWVSVPEGRVLKRGDSDSPQRLAALRARLAAEGFDVVGNGGGAPRGTGVYDSPLAAAVAEFQARHAIGVDSMLGAETVSALNVPATYRLGQIAANLERHRWMPRRLGDRHIVVNVPAFRLEAFDRGEKVLEMKVIVGQEYSDKATPVFSDVMETVVFRPYWNITPAIQANEIGPKIAANPGYMARENLEYYKDGGETRIRQRPGGKNALGLVKFLFPNDFNIYMHDTPSHELFDKDVRAFSHGCIRLEKPAELAQWVLGWDAGKVRQQMEDGRDNHTVKLPRRIPVYITYATAYIRDGKLYFGNDLYHRDERIVSASADGALPSPRVVQALDALKRIATG